MLSPATVTAKCLADEIRQQAQQSFIRLGQQLTLLMMPQSLLVHGPYQLLSNRCSPGQADHLPRFAAAARSRKLGPEASKRREVSNVSAPSG